MKKTILLLAMFFTAFSLFAQKPIVKFYLQDGSSKQYFIEEISKIDCIKSNLSYSMKIFIGYSEKTYDLKNINSIDFSIPNKLNIVLSQSSESVFLKDIDSMIFIQNTCNEIAIFNQTWMCKNLDVSTYQNGDAIPQVTSETEWANLTTGAWCYYNNDSANGTIYGKLYNWYAVNDPRGLAPAGWHLPTDAEWTTLTTYLGGESVAGGKMKGTGTIETGTGLWYDPNEGATNESGFSAHPGGYRGSSGTFYYIGYRGNWWSATEPSSTHAWYRTLFYYYSNVFRSFSSKESGFSVRCLRD